MKKRRINKKLLYVVLSVIIVSVLTLTIAYAVLSSNLTISGSTEVSGSSWNISVSKYDAMSDTDLTEEEIENLLDILGWKIFYNGYATGDADLIKDVTISGTTISGLQVSLAKPGDMIVFYFSVTNNGTIPATVESVVQNTPSFSSNTNNSADLELIFNNWFSEIVLYPDINFNYDEKIDSDYTLCPGETIYLMIGCRIDDTATAVPSSDITVSNLGGTINFVQSDKSLCTR